MAAQALSFCTSFWGNSNPSSSSSIQQRQKQHLNPNTLSFEQSPKRQKSSNPLSFSSNTYNARNPNCFNSINPVALKTHNPNPFYTHPNPNQLFSANPSFFDPPSPQTLAPLTLHEDYGFSDPLWPPAQDCYEAPLGYFEPDPIPAPEPIPDFSSPEDQFLLAPFLAEPEQINAVEFQPVAPPPPRDYHKENVINVPLQKPCAGGCGGGGGGGGGTVVSPQSIAARERRRKITERTSELGKLIPGGNKMSTAEMFQAAYKYIKFLQAQVSVLQHFGSSNQGLKQEEQLHIKELQILSSPIIQEKLYSEEKCLVPKQFHDQTFRDAQRNLS